MKRNYFLPLTALIFGLIGTEVNAQENESGILLKDVKGQVVKKGNAGADTLSRFRSGIFISESQEGIVYRSHLRDYNEITVELSDKEGKVIYQYKNEMLRNVNYTLGVKDVPPGEYILQFTTEDRLVVCNLSLRG